MKQAKNLNLRRYNSFGIRATARRAVQIDHPGDLAAIDFDPETGLVLGGGSNVLIANDIGETVLLNRLSGMRIAEARGDRVVVEAAGGELWHALVLWSLTQELSGLENLSLIPGLAGAAPIQNIGAYGVELSDRLVSVQAWDWRERRLVDIPHDACAFGYRHSRFKGADSGRFLVTAIRLELDRSFTPHLDYAGLSDQLKSMDVANPTARQVSQAVIMLRKRKLPDPARIGNAGSFFKNPVVPADKAETLREQYPGIPAHPGDDGTVKLSAAWMIERCGWKGHREGDAGISEQHALVLVNHGAATGYELLELARRVAASVQEAFGVSLEPEPVIVGDRW